jgi:DUF971 family protein
MSHEGIRFVRRNEALGSEAESFANRPLPREATSPAHVRVNKTAGTGVEIVWKDGHQSSWSFAWLRNACPCATCIEEREAAGRKPGEAKPKPVSLLPMYEAPVRPGEVEQVGNYAIRFHWSDGHKSGIYSWDYLRRSCPCEACQSGVAEAGIAEPPVLQRP